MCQLITHADDLGISEPVNDAIFSLMDQGAVTSASLLACGNAVEAAARRVKDFPGRSFGIHLCATDLRPLTASPNLAPVLGADGAFIGGPAIGRATPSLRLMQAVLDEWLAQVRRLRELGVPVSHIDSHHHVHTRPWLFPVLKRFQRLAGLRKVRLSMNVYSDESKPSRGMWALKSLYNASLRNIVRSVTTDGFTSFATYMKVADRLPKSIRTLEVMLHPGNSVYDDETAALMWLWQQRQSLPVRFISHNDLHLPKQ